MFSKLTVWYWITNQYALPYSRQFMSFSAFFSCLQFFVQGFWPLGFCQRPASAYRGVLSERVSGSPFKLWDQAQNLSFTPDGFKFFFFVCVCVLLETDLPIAFCILLSRDSFLLLFCKLSRQLSLPSFCFFVLFLFVCFCISIQ